MTTHIERCTFHLKTRVRLELAVSAPPDVVNSGRGPPLPIAHFKTRALLLCAFGTTFDKIMYATKPLMKQAAIVLAIFLGACGAGAVENTVTNAADLAVKHVNAGQAQKLVADKTIVTLDIRTPGEFTAAHIAGATNLDFRAVDFEQRLTGLDKSKTYFVYCASGNRSTQALPLFKKLRFQSLYHLDGGFKGWEKAGLPVAK
jgi:rhodanese-related sulfurtransferase